MTPIIVIVGLVVLILGHESGHFFAAKSLKMKVDEFGVGFPPKIFGRRRGDTEYSLNWLPFGGFVRIAGENDRLADESESFEKLPEEEKAKLFYFRPAWQRSFVMLSGIAMNLIIGWMLLSLVYAIGIAPALIVENVQENSPAFSAGFKSGDSLKGYSSVQEFIDFTNANRGREVEISILRDSEEKNIKVVLRENNDSAPGALGVSLAEVGLGKESNPLKIARNGLESTYQITISTIVGFFDLLRNIMFKASLPAGVVGPVGIFGIANTAGNAGIVLLAQIMAVISINLAVLNLIPFPALDGGRFLIIIIESIKRSRVSKKTEAVVNSLGFLFLIALMVIVTARDVIKLF